MSNRLWSPPNLLPNENGEFFPRGEKQQKRESDHSPPTNAEFKKTWIYTSTFPYAFTA
jgi:hypothetical protein